MSSERRRGQMIEAFRSELPAVTAELARLYLASEPDDRSALLIFGDALASLARHAEARASYERALELSGPEQRLAPLRQLGHLYEERGEFREAERYFREAIASAPVDASAYVYLGALLARSGRLDEAEEVLARGTRCVDGEISEVYCNLDLVQRGRRDYLSALESLRQALQVDPEYALARRALADVERVLFEFPAPEA
jgi:tetratricopeptide (TPR) repeat protein